MKTTRRLILELELDERGQIPADAERFFAILAGRIEELRRARRSSVHLRMELNTDGKVIGAARIVDARKPLGSTWYERHVPRSA